MAPSNYTVLCSKALTHSDVTTEIAKSGRLVLPRAQVVSCLPRLLHLGGAAPASAKARPGGPTPAIPLFMYDMSGKMWRFQMKTWHNVVACGGRATYVLENTAGFVQEFGLQPGAWLAICEQEGRLVLRTDLGGVRASARAPPAAAHAPPAPRAYPAPGPPASCFEAWAASAPMSHSDAGMALVSMQCDSSSSEGEAGHTTAALRAAMAADARALGAPASPPRALAVLVRPTPVHGAIWVQQTLQASQHQPAQWTLTRVPSGPAPASEERTGAELARALRMV
uniref:TF-B3 domain-containing protein n=1 Tax=Auxenochlorella protothecoides TaxID=3075 RepID=A0A1D2A6T4_AUXPR